MSQLGSDKNPLDFLIIGAMKAGTTSVHKYLSEHHRLYLPPEKEAPFFSDDDAYGKGYTDYFKDYFRNLTTDSLLGTVTPLYMMNPAVPQRIKDTCPNVKLIAILRDPIERAYSHYHMAVRVKGEMRTFEEAIVEQLKGERLAKARKNCAYWSDYVVFGEYGRILNEFYQHFPESQIKILYMNCLIDSPNVFMEEIFDFIGVERIEIKNLGKNFHDSKSKGIMPLIARIGFNPKVRSVGKHFFSNRLRRRITFWLGLHRSFGGKEVESGFILSPKTRKKLESSYFEDSKILSNITGQLPYWVSNWQKQGDCS